MIVYNPYSFTVDAAISGVRTYASQQRFTRDLITVPVTEDNPSGLETYKFIRENLGWPVTENGVSTDLSIFRYDPEFHMEESPRAMLFPFEIFASGFNSSIINYTNQVSSIMNTRLWRSGDVADSPIYLHEHVVDTRVNLVTINHNLGFIPNVLYLAADVVTHGTGGYTCRTVVRNYDILVPTDESRTSTILIRGFSNSAAPNDPNAIYADLSQGVIYLY